MRSTSWTIARRLRLERQSVSSPAHGSGRVVCRPGRRGRSKPRKRVAIPRHKDLSDHRGGTRAGNGKLAVDGVVLVGEHGDYPRNERVRRNTRVINSLSRSSKSTGPATEACRCSATSTLLEMGLGQADVRHVAKHGLPVYGRLQPAGDLAHSVD